LAAASTDTPATKIFLLGFGASRRGFCCAKATGARNRIAVQNAVQTRPGKGSERGRLAENERD